MNDQGQMGRYKNRLIAFGVIALCALIGLANYGLRWEETYEHAQILTGAVEYPEGHPLQVYVRSAPSLQTFASGILLQVSKSPYIIEATRNLLALLIVLLAMMALGFALGDSMIFGTLFAFFGAHLELDSSYPMHVWPGAFTNGPIGMGYMLMALAALAAQRWGIAAFLVAAAPAIHLAQAPPIVMTTVLLLFWSLVTKDNTPKKSSIVPLVAGLIVTVLVFVVAAMNAPDLATTGAYAAVPDAGETWRAYTFHHDMHRAPPPANSVITAFLSLFVCGAALWLTRNEDAKKKWAFSATFIFVSSTIFIVTIAHLIRLALGDATPFLFIGWMPYRLLNMLPLVTIATAVGALSTRRTTVFPCTLLITIALITKLPMLTAFPMIRIYFGHGEFMFFALCGAVFGLLPFAPTNTRWSHLAVGLVIAAVIAPFHQFGAACIALGMVMGVATGILNAKSQTDSPQPLSRLKAVSVVIITIALGVQCLSPPLPREHLAKGEFEAAIRDYLATQDPDAMIAAGPNAFMVQAQTGHPVFVDTTTLSLMSYMPKLGPVINTMHDEVYGMPITSGPRNPDQWLDVWSQRTREEWAALKPWGFTYVAAPSTITLDLDPILQAGDQRLYRMP